MLSISNRDCWESEIISEHIQLGRTPRVMIGLSSFITSIILVVRSFEQTATSLSSWESVKFKIKSNTKKKNQIGERTLFRCTFCDIFITFDHGSLQQAIHIDWVHSTYIKQVAIFGDSEASSIAFLWNKMLKSVDINSYQRIRYSFYAQGGMTGDERWEFHHLRIARWWSDCLGRYWSILKGYLTMHQRQPS